jgi:hypothetical protein
MTDNEESVWAKIAIRQSVHDLRKHGPTFEVGVTDIATGTSKRVYAQIDTGADHTCVSPVLARALHLKAIDICIVRQPNEPVRGAPYFKVRLSLPLADIDLDVALLTTLDAPHDVLIGRDILANSRLSIDFASGATDLHIRTF